MTHWLTSCMKHFTHVNFLNKKERERRQRDEWGMKLSEKVGLNYALTETITIEVDESRGR